MDGRSFLPQLRGGRGNPREWIFFHFDPRSRNPVPPQRWLRDHRWKLYEDGRLYDLTIDPEETSAVFPEDDTPDQAGAREQLEPVFARMTPSR